jgi:integrase
VGHFLQAWGDCLRYAQRINVLSDVEKIPGPQTGVHTAKRIEILSPYAAGVMWRRCREHGGEWGEQAAAAVMLGFYAGLRANEVLSLTLADVVIDPGELGLVINYGKTDAAKRQIPLEVLAPRELVAWFTEWVARRRAQFTDPAFKNRPGNQIAVFGPAGNPAGYARKALIDPLIRWMRTSLGDDVDFHLLRHSFASWLVLRFYAMRHPGFAERLPQRAATMFQPHALEQLRVCHDGDVYRRDGIDDATHIRKLTGHESLHTTLLYYVHTLDWVHADVMRRAFHEGPRRKLA